MSHDHPHGDHEHDGHDHGGHHLHVTPFWPMLIVFVLLLFFTWLTVTTSRMHYIPFGNTTIEISGTAHIILALGIATIKSALVLGFFMHLLYDKALNTIVLASTLFAVSLFMGLTLMDTAVRDNVTPLEGDVGRWAAATRSSRNP